jgi:hypothetical protein
MNYEEISKYILEIKNKNQTSLNEETHQAVDHYLLHDEYEMAFEILFLELMKKELFKDIDIFKSKKTAIFLKLNKESIFDFNFWKKFEAFCERSKQS